ncbi:MAG: organic solvent tolerance protein OstA [Rhodospirillales bacterium 20-64-7]|nr:MAG: organic solvent tolerance protein OstA [Rhodospirillales bacterium 20-64-7]
MRIGPACAAAALGAALCLPAASRAEAQTQAPAGGAPQPVQITASQGITWQQNSQTVTANGNAKAVRGPVTVEADTLVAHYRKKPGATSGPAGAASAADELNQGGAQLYQLDAIGHVHIFTKTDNAWGDHAVYSVDSQVLVLTGQHLKLTTAHDTVTAKDAIEYYSVKRIAIARGDARIVADDGRSIAADTLVGYLAPPAPAPGAQAPQTNGNNDILGQAGKLQKVDAFGHVVIHTQTDTATGERGVYLPQEGKARLGGNVHIIRGPNELAGADALVNMKTGVATLLAGKGGQVAGTIIPGSAQIPGQGPSQVPGAPKEKHK